MAVAFQLFKTCFIHISLVAKPLLLPRALDDQMSIYTLTFQCLVNVGPIVMHSPSVIEFKGSPFRDSIFGHVNGRVVVLFLYPPEDLPESKGCHLQPDRTRVQPAAVGHCGYTPVEEDTAQGQSPVPGTSVPRAEVLLLLLTSPKTTCHALLYNHTLCKSAVAEDVMLVPNLCILQRHFYFSRHNAVLEHTKLPCTPTCRNARLNPLS